MFKRFFLLCLALLAVGSWSLATETLFEVMDIDGNSTLGTISALDGEQLVVHVRGENQTILVEKLCTVRNLAPSPYEGVAAVAAQTSRRQSFPSALSRRNTYEQRLVEEFTRRIQANEQILRKTFPNSVIVLELKDGSQLSASSFTIANNQGICRLLEQQNDLFIPLNDISAVRFAARSLLETRNPPEDWLRLAIPSAGGDKLIVGNPGSFDVYAGILGEVSTETISFAVDGEVLPVPRRRVFGLVLHGDTTPSPSGVPPLATLTLWTGTKGMISDIRLNGNELTWQTTAGLTVTVPLDMVYEIDFGEQGIAYLVDFDQERSEFALPFALASQPEQWRLLQTFFNSRTSPREVMLDGVVYTRGITLLGKTLIEYRLPKPFASLRGVIGIEDQFRPHASARLQILADSQVLGTWDLRGDRASQRIDLQLPHNCRLISITVEPLPQSGGSTVLTIADPKLSE